MSEVRRAMPGTARRISSIFLRMKEAEPLRFIALRTRSSMCCTGTSRYRQTFSSAAIVARSSAVTLFG